MAYAFDLRQVCGGYAYFSTFTLGRPSTDDRFEIREPSLAQIDGFSKALKELGQTARFIDTLEAYRVWIYVHGWALVEPAFARTYMPQWLKQHRCIHSAQGSYTDIEIASPGALKRSYRGQAKKEIHARDGGHCLVCGAEEKLTLRRPPGIE